MRDLSNFGNNLRDDILESQIRHETGYTISFEYVDEEQTAIKLKLASKGGDILSISDKIIVDPSGTRILENVTLEKDHTLLFQFKNPANNFKCDISEIFIKITVEETARKAADDKIYKEEEGKQPTGILATEINRSIVRDDLVYKPAESEGGEATGLLVDEIKRSTERDDLVYKPAKSEYDLPTGKLVEETTDRKNADLELDNKIYSLNQALDADVAARKQGDILESYRDKIGGQTFRLPYYFTTEYTVDSAKVRAYTITLDGQGIVDNTSYYIDVPSANYTTAGLESAEDKLHLDYLYSQEVDKGAVRLLGNEAVSGEPYHFTYYYDIDRATDKITANAYTITLDNTYTTNKYSLDIPAATEELAGLMTKADKIEQREVREDLTQETLDRNNGDLLANYRNKLVGGQTYNLPYYFSVGYSDTTATVTAYSVSLDGQGTLRTDDLIIPSATDEKAGLMSAEDHKDITAISYDKENKITNISDSVQEKDVKISDSLIITSDKAAAGKEYAVKINADGKILSEDFAVNSPSASDDNYQVEFIDTVSQDSKGKISATKGKFKIEDGGQGSIKLNNNAISITNLGTTGKPTFTEATIPVISGNTVPTAKTTGTSTFALKEDVDDADAYLQEQIDAIESRTDVVDVVALYDNSSSTEVPKPTDLVHYDISKLHDNDVIKVLKDNNTARYVEGQPVNDIAYYRWCKATPEAVSNSWNFVGSIGPYYTKAESDKNLSDAIEQEVLDRNNAITNAINTLDVSDISGFGADKTLQTLAETDGKISATFQTINISSDKITDKEDAYNSTSSNVITGKGVKAAIDTLDTTVSGMSKAKTVKSLTETDGIISAEFEDISIASSQVNDKTNSYNGESEALVTGKAIKAALETLDVNAISISQSETVKSISEADGKISVEKQNIQIAESQVSNLVDDLNSKVDKVIATSKVYGTDASGGQTTYNVDSFGKVDDVQVNNVSVVDNKIANIDLTGKVDKQQKIAGIDLQDDITDTELLAGLGLKVEEGQVTAPVSQATVLIAEAQALTDAQKIQVKTNLDIGCDVIYDGSNITQISISQIQSYKILILTGYKYGFPDDENVATAVFSWFGFGKDVTGSKKWATVPLTLNKTVDSAIQAWGTGLQFSTEGTGQSAVLKWQTTEYSGDTTFGVNHIIGIK